MIARGLEPDILQRVLRAALARGGDFADVFVEHRVSQAVRLQDGKIHEAGLSVIVGAGVRVISGEQQGYAYTDDLGLPALLEAARVASLVARSGGSQGRTVDLTAVAVPARYTVDKDAEALGDLDTFAAYLDRVDRTARAFDPRVETVNGSVTSELQHVQIASSDGRLVYDTRPLLALVAQIVAKQNGVRGQGYYGDGGRTTLAFYEKTTPESIAREAARIAIVNVEAREAPAGEMQVVVGAGGGGVLLHEAVGHGLEGDFNREQTSLYSGRIGERVASELVTIYDDGNLDGERGTVSVDDEGMPGQHKVLVERGILRGYMHDRLNARLMGGTSTGSGRRQNFRFLPQPRMCNTYMPPGEATFDEIIGSVDRGVYATSFAGGQVDISRGDFVFMVAEGYLIEGGKITAPIRGATLIGNGPQIMEKVVAVGHDARLAQGQYTCGKAGQLVPVGVGLPTVKVASLTVGGSAV